MSRRVQCPVSSRVSSLLVLTWLLSLSFSSFFLCLDTLLAADRGPNRIESNRIASHRTAPHRTHPTHPIDPIRSDPIQPAMSLQSQTQVFLDRVKESLQKYEETMQLDQYAILNQAHQQTKQPRIYILCAAALVASIIIVQLLGLSFISNCFAFVPSQQHKTRRHRDEMSGRHDPTHTHTPMGWHARISCCHSVLFPFSLCLLQGAAIRREGG